MWLRMQRPLWSTLGSPDGARKCSLLAMISRHPFLQLYKLSFSLCWQTLEDLDKFADLVKEVTISACRYYLAEHMQSSNTGLCAATEQTCSIGRSGAEYSLLLTMTARSHLSQMIRKKETSSSRSRRPFTPAASSGEVTHVHVATREVNVNGAAGFRVVRDIACREEEEEVKKNKEKT